MRVLNQMLEVKERFDKQRKELSEQLINQWLLIEDKLHAVKLDVIRSDWWQESSVKLAQAGKPTLRPVPMEKGKEEAIRGCENLLWGEWLMVSQQMINQFADVTQDRQWIHIDEARAALESPYKSTIAHGFLVLSLIPTMVPKRDWRELLCEEPAMIINVGLENARFLSALKANCEVRASIRTISICQVKRGARVIEEVTIESRHGKTIAVAQMIYRLVFASEREVRTFDSAS